MTQICIDARMISAGGIGTYIKNILGALKDKAELTLLAFEKDRDLLLQFNPEKIIILKSKIYSWQEQLELFRKIPKTTLFISPHFNIPLLPIRAKKRLVTIHDTYHLTHLQSLKWLQKCYALCLYNAATLLSDIVTTVSEFSKLEILKQIYFKPKNIAVIKHGIDMHGATKSAKESAQKKYQLPEKFILAVGTPKPHKNLKRLFKAYSGDIVVVGPCQKKQGRQHFLENVSDDELRALYSLADVFVFPSLYEGFGLPPLEAMACGCPTAVSHIPSLKEVCGDSAFYFDPKSEKSIASTIESLLSNPKKREEMAAKGRAHVKQFDMKTFSDSFHNLLKQACACE